MDCKTYFEKFTKQFGIFRVYQTGKKLMNSLSNFALFEADIIKKCKNGQTFVEMMTSRYLVQARDPCSDTNQIMTSEDIFM